MNVINELDKRMYSYVKSKYYKNVKLKKTCKNGVVLETESYWDDSFLSWKKSDKSFVYQSNRKDVGFAKRITWQLPDLD